MLESPSHRVLEGADRVFGRDNCFVTDFGGSLYVFQLDGITLDADPDHPPIVTNVVASWLPKKSVSDPDLPSNVWDVVVDETPSGIYVYVSVLRRGVQVLRFDPVPGTLTEIELIQTSWRASGLQLRGKKGVKTLIVADHGAGIRIYGKPDRQQCSIRWCRASRPGASPSGPRAGGRPRAGSPPRDRRAEWCAVPDVPAAE